MWINYLKTAFRNLKRSKGFSIVNILGLAVGIAVFILISLYVQYELSFDKHFTDANRIYRVTMDMQWSQGPTQETAVAPGPTAYHLAKEYPEVIAGTRLTFLDQSMIEYKPEDGSRTKRFYEKNLMVADSNLFDVFSINIIHGNPKALTLKNSIIVSEKICEKYFGNEDPIGKALYVDKSNKFIVNAVMEDIPENTHFQTDFIASAVGRPEYDVNNWLPLQLFSYIKFSENAVIDGFEDKLLDFRDRHYTNWKDMSLFRLQKMLDIHLKNDRMFDFAITTDINQVYVLSGVALLILIIACINFMNLSTARSVQRSKEVGIRKVVGGTRKMLIRQFIAESVLVSLIATFLAVVIIESFIPEFRRIVDVHLIVDYSKNLVMLIVLAIVVGIFSGIYPAFFTSAFKPVEILKGKNDTRGNSIIIRKILVIFQFVIMALLLIGILVVYKQMSFIKNKNLGFSKDMVVYSTVDFSVSNTAPFQIKNKLETNPNFQSVAVCNVLPGTTPWGDHFRVEGFDDSFPLRTLNAGTNYLELLELKLISGRYFSTEFGTDSTACVINEAAVKRFGWTPESALGKSLSWNYAGTAPGSMVEGHVIGVIKDYHFKSLHEEIEALVITMNSAYNYIVAAKISADRVDESIQFLEQTYRDVLPQFAFEYHFLDNEIDGLYKSEKRFETIVLYFVFLAIFIAGLGLIGLTAFMAEKKFKEIGIRKTFGAGVSQIIYLFSKEFAIWAIIANIIAWPVGWLLMNNWLENFAYRTEISLWIFPLVLIISVLIAIITVSYLAYKAAIKNPVEAIRWE